MVISDARDLLGSRNQKKIGNNTYLSREEYKGSCRYRVTLHCTDIVTFYPDGRIRLSNGGWFTRATSDRIYKVLRSMGTDLEVSLYTRSGKWILVDRFGEEYIWGEGARPKILPDGSIKGLKSLLHKAYEEISGSTVEPEMIPELITGSDLKVFKKLWRKAGSQKVRLVELARREFLPLLMGMPKSRYEKDGWTEALNKRLRGEA